MFYLYLDSDMVAMTHSIYEVWKTLLEICNLNENEPKATQLMNLIFESMVNGDKMYLYGMEFGTVRLYRSEQR